MITYIVGNAKNIKGIFSRKRIPAPNLIISSPPYFDLLNYGGNIRQIGYGQIDYKEYLNDVANVFQDCFDISKKNASFWLIIDTFKKDGEVITLPFDIHKTLKDTYKKTWKLKEIIIWDKEKNLPWNAKGKFKNQFEYILFFTKGPNYKFNIDRVREINDLKKWWKSFPERYNPDGKAPSNLWHYTTPIQGWGNNKQNHFCPFPFPLAEKIISISTDKGDVICDPFAGSGSALAIGYEMGRNAIGIDINKRYKLRFEKEVLIRAKQYWKARKVELKTNISEIENFSKTNQKLRKLKAGSSICHYINEKNKQLFSHLIINGRGNKFELCVVENGVIPDVEIDDEMLNKLVRQAKVDPIIAVINQKELKKKIQSRKIFKYAYSKIYCNILKVKNADMCDIKASDKHFYSTIEMKIK